MIPVDVSAASKSTNVALSRSLVWRYATLGSGTLQEASTSAMRTTQDAPSARQRQIGTNLALVRGPRKSRGQALTIP